jgi:DNA-binding NarL/FixJ family response regulator
VAIRVALADDSLLVREGIEQVLASQPDIEVVASCADLPSLLAAVDAEHPDVVLTDIRMPPSMSDEGIRVASRLRETHPDVGVVVLSQYSEPEYVLALLELSSSGRGYLLKERVHDRAQLVSAMETVARGGSVIDPDVVDVLVSAKARNERSALAELSPREREVLALIAEGKSNSAIAESLVLTKRAVEGHINSIFQKLELPPERNVSKRVTAPCSSWRRPTEERRRADEGASAPVEDGCTHHTRFGADVIARICRVRLTTRHVERNRQASRRVDCHTRETRGVAMAHRNRRSAEQLLLPPSGPTPSTGIS